ncbi:hypothetical protein GGS23DRAFT_573576 [Durotheca rogersii]|uniref:uncharacterized protein n=1 Tax=Durotheca rogersii TaxID=419775 RepID=UPI00221FD438|nr:uncharacterized protein GGS23DRAFT_573576 [Durotheca rogersii]KAI5862286.1 hypothetical protein GGS23DRAFT_573576 [Durotheca rogersii]
MPALLLLLPVLALLLVALPVPALLPVLALLLLPAGVRGLFLLPVLPVLPLLLLPVLPLLLLPPALLPVPALPLTRSHRSPPSPLPQRKGSKQQPSGSANCSRPLAPLPRDTQSGPSGKPQPFCARTCEARRDRAKKAFMLPRVSVMRDVDEGTEAKDK